GKANELHPTPLINQCSSYSNSGWLLVMLPFDRDNPNNYYTVELRTPNLVDRGIAQVTFTNAVENINAGEQDASSKTIQFIRVSLKQLSKLDADVHISSTFNPID
ncbi:hypothetical protein Mgra_00008236, partial [Meloidogyne graminicola]